MRSRPSRIRRSSSARLAPGRRTRPLVVDRAARLEHRGRARSTRRRRRSSCGRPSSRRRRPRSRTGLGSPSTTGPARGCGERLDPRARPDEREAEREVDCARPARPLTVHEPEPFGGRPAPRSCRGGSLRARGPSRPRRSRSRAASARSPARVFPRARLDQQRRRVDGARKRVEPGLRVRRRLPDHAIGRLCPERQLQPDRSRARGRAPRRARGCGTTGGRGSSARYPVDEADVRTSRPSGASSARGLDAEEGRLTPAAGSTRQRSQPFIPQKFVR